MGITEWVAVLVIFAVVYCLIKRYETRLVLIGSGLLLCLISWNLVGGLNAFAKSMTNASLVMAICGSMGFAFVAKYTEADRSLVHYLSAPIRGLGIFLVPVCTAITFFVNIAIPSAAGCAAAVGSTLIPVMLRGHQACRRRCCGACRYDRLIPLAGYVPQSVRGQHGAH